MNSNSSLLPSARYSELVTSSRLANGLWSASLVFLLMTALLVSGTNGWIARISSSDSGPRLLQLHFFAHHLPILHHTAILLFLVGLAFHLVAEDTLVGIVTGILLIFLVNKGICPTRLLECCFVDLRPRLNALVTSSRRPFTLFSDNFCNILFTNDVPEIPTDFSSADDESTDPVDDILRQQIGRIKLFTQGQISPLAFQAASRAFDHRIASLVVRVLGSRAAKRSVLRLNSRGSQLFLDAVHDVLDKGSLPTTDHASQARRLIHRLSEAQDQLPSTLFIVGVTDREEHPAFYGGFGDIYRASYKGTAVALKRTRLFQHGPELVMNRSKFCREALVWQALRHKYILPLIGIDRNSFSSYCLVSPWMKHGTILKYLREHRPHANPDKLILQIAEGLGYLHSKNIVHGDLRGANILVSDDESIRLADFGLSSICEADSTAGILRRSSDRAGSARWFAPELIIPTEFGCEQFARTTASDVYAFGCVCLELHTGKPPFSDVSEEMVVVLKVRDGERPARPSTMSDGLWAVVTAAWAQKFQYRPGIQTIITILSEEL